MTRKTPEGRFNSETLHDRLDLEFPGCKIIKQDPNTSFQGVPDHLVIYGDKWALLEAKRGAKAAQQPNQAHYIEEYNSLGFASFINPNNIDDVIDRLKDHFQS